MALFNKFFSSRKKLAEGCLDSSTTRANEFPFCGSQVRVLLFRECEWTGRRILFDSSAISKISASEQQPEENGKPARHLIEVVNGYAYYYGANAADGNSIGEMIYGSIAMTNRGTSLKVHWLTEPTRILCSQVFPSPSNHLKSNYSREALANKNTQASSTRDASNPMDVPKESSSVSCGSMYLNSACDSGYDAWSSTASNLSRSTGASLLSAAGNDEPNTGHRKPSADSAAILSDVMGTNFSDGAMHRRVLRNLSTSFENSFIASELAGNGGIASESSSNALGYAPTQRRHSDHTQFGTPQRGKTGSRDHLSPKASSFTAQTATRSRPPARRSKIGLAICITLSPSVEREMQIFCSEHISFLESVLCRARMSVEYAYLNHKKFHHVMLRMWLSTVSWITDLFTAPRISQPIWLTLTAFERTEKSKGIAKSFMTELCWLLTHADTKDTNFFISTLLTAILTNHLGWIETICGDYRSDQAKYQRISKYHPYNALWAQLSDICGAFGCPKKSTKTVVCGAQSAIINKVLSTLTYFIRCGEIKRIFATKNISSDDVEAMLSAREQSARKSAPSRSEAAPTQLMRSKTIAKHLASISDNESHFGAETADDTECANETRRVIDCDDGAGDPSVETALDAMAALDESEEHSAECDTRIDYCATETATDRSRNRAATTDSNGNEVDKTREDSVVFMLGENEVLSGIKKTSEAPEPAPRQPKEVKPKPEIGVDKKKNCSHKKHSGVKFNFERYPQIVTNYMRNKNLDIDSYDFLQKGIKLEHENEASSGACSTNLLPLIVPEDPAEDEEEEECECCANTFRVLQTPSNATELEFSSDDNTYPMPTTTTMESSLQPKLKIANAAEKLKPTDAKAEKAVPPAKRTLDLIYLPIPKTTILQDVLSGKDPSIGLYPGFAPSLFVGVSDHYIPDMVLQGTTAHPKKWEPQLEENKDLLSHYASFDQLPTENLIILANVDEWNVKLISSQNRSVYKRQSSTTVVGMSQLVATMLEAVHVMWSAGISAHECLRFIEAKLKEMYIHSEALAEFLLSTEFCSLNTVTSTLDISENDVPLLLSVASIHSPHVSRKYGISFR